MPRHPLKGHAALRAGRESLPGADYFLTICTNQRRAGLTVPVVAQAILAEAASMQVDGTYALRCLTIMPDHVHLLITLGARLPLGKTLSRLKAKTSSALRAHDLAWERGFFDHRVRPDEDRAPIFHYLHLNPYRANLCARTEPWPWFHCCDADRAWFKPSLDDNLQSPAWLS